MRPEGRHAVPCYNLLSTRAEPTQPLPATINDGEHNMLPLSDVSVLDEVQDYTREAGQRLRASLNLMRSQSMTGVAGGSSPEVSVVSSKKKTHLA
jgi:hypothetical protein